MLAVSSISVEQRNFDYDDVEAVSKQAAAFPLKHILLSIIIQRLEDVTHQAPVTAAML